MSISESKKYIENLVGTSAHSLEVSGVNVTGTGADATINPLLHAYIKPLLRSASVDELAAACTQVQTGLFQLGSYSDVQLALEPQKSLFGAQSLLANLQLTAAKRFTLQTGTNVGNAEGYGYIKGTTRNYFGLGEVLTIDTHMGTRTKQSHLLTLSFPGALFKLPIDWKAEGLAYVSSKMADWGAHKEQVRGATLRCTHRLHSFGIDGVLRTLYSEKDTTLQSPTFCAQAGHAFKLSAFANYTRDTRDNAFLPTAGSLIRLANELAVGDHPMIKSALDLQLGHKFNDDLSCVLTTRLGYLRPLQGTSHLMDRFYMGGPLDIRGFGMNRAGPHEGSISVGGNVLATSGVSLFTRIPRAADNLKFHLFANAGGLENTVTGLLRPRVSAGFGLAYNHPISRFELNIAMPLVAAREDGCSKGLQLGVGISYL